MKRFRILLIISGILLAGSMKTVSAQQLPSEGQWGTFANVVDAEGELELTGDVDMVGVVRIPLGKTFKLTSKKNVTIRNLGIGTNNETTDGRSRMFTVKGSGGKLIIEAAEGCTITLDGGADFIWNNYELAPGINSRTLSEAICNEGTLELKNVIIRNVNGSNPNGGAINIDGSADGPTTLTNCKIENCYSQLGSAIMIQGSKPVTIINSKINRCISGGGNVGNSGGAIRTYGSVSASLYLTGVKFTENYARRNVNYNNTLEKDGNGGALFWNARGTNNTKCVIDGCEFAYNRSDDNGGAIKSQATIEFVNNTTKIHHNSAPIGGGLYIEGYTGGASVSGARTIRYSLNEFMEVYDNSSPSYEYDGKTFPGKGAGVHLYFGDKMKLEAGSAIELEMNGARIYNNISDGSESTGGGIYFENTSLPEMNYTFDIKLSYGSVTGNSAGLGGGLFVSKGEVTSERSGNAVLEIRQNTGYQNGAGIYIQDGSLSMANGNITGNSISGNGNGGGIFIENGDFTINAGEISGNSVGNGNGGGVYIVGSGDLGNFVMNGGSITGNSATGTQKDTGFGGGIYVNGGNFTMTEEDALGMISSNAATRDGGGVYISGGKFQQDNGSISSNVSEADGGGVCIVNGGSFTMAGGSITANGKQNSTIKTENGGGVYLNGGNFVLEDGTISGNGAIENGGGVFLTGDNCRYELKKGDITGNSAGNGGGVYLEKGLFILGNDVNLQEGNISSNTATFGGGVYIGSADNGSVTIADDAQDTEPTEGFIMRGGTITSNTTVNDGGGIYLNGGSFLMNNGDIVDNSSSTDGGGVCIANNGNFTMNNGNITGNGKKGSDVVTVNGGGVYLDGGRLIVSAGNISHNAATASGGGVYISNGSVEMGDGEVQSNTCGAYGGGIYVYNDPQSSLPKNVEVSGGNLLKNTAVYGGGICVDGPINLNIGNVEIAENTATNGGGVCLMNSANMTFGAGQIKNNIANKSEGSGTYQKTTAYQKDITEVEGIGGGIYLNSNTKLVFNDTDELGLFGNKAGNGADEIFANGKDTFVNLPNVTGMALDGYPGAGNLKWLEDYITDDTEYDEGTFIRNTDKYLPGAWATDGKNMRYRDAISQNERNWIFELEGEANAENGLGFKYICFALGYEIIYVTITRSGLAAGESAIYKLAKTDGGTSFSIIITGDGSDSISKKVAVTAGTWSITETDWSYAYNLTITDENVQDDGKTITKDISDEEDRQFIFAGSRKDADALPLNFEDVVVNVAGN